MPNLADAYALLARRGIKHGQWLRWIEEHLEFDRKTAWRYMQVFCHKDKWGSVPHLNAAYALLARKSEAEVDIWQRRQMSLSPVGSRF